MEINLKDLSTKTYSKINERVTEQYYLKIEGIIVDDKIHCSLHLIVRKTGRYFVHSRNVQAEELTDTRINELYEEIVKLSKE